jgi:hypothetical protein
MNDETEIVSKDKVAHAPLWLAETADGLAVIIEDERRNQPYT